MLDIHKIREIILLSSETVWGITSINKRVGKTFISRMIADELNKVGKKVLFFTVSEQPLGEDYYEIEDLKEAISVVEDIPFRKNVYVCASQKADSIVFDQKFEDLIDLYKTNYDYVIMDIPSMDESGFAKRICKKCDGNFVIVSKGAEDGVSVGEKINQLQKVNIKVSGVILNEYSNKKRILQM